MGLNDFYQIFRLYLCAENAEKTLKFQKYTGLQSVLTAVQTCTVV